MAVIFVDIGQDVHFVNGNLTDAINEGVRRGYNEGYLRKSVVADPLKGSTPVIIHRRLFITTLWTETRSGSRSHQRDLEVKTRAAYLCLHLRTVKTA